MPLRCILISCFCLMALTGCAVERKFDITVENRSSRPVTLWLVKQGGSAQASWRSPEEIAMMTEWKEGERIGGVVVPPNKVGENVASGKFESDSVAILRIYDGQLDMARILATHVGILRKDVKLSPGKNRFVIADAPSLRVEQIEPKP